VNNAFPMVKRILLILAIFIILVAKFVYANELAIVVKNVQKAADQGDASAQVNLGSMYIDGKGVAQDDKQAVKWYRKAANQGNANAQYNLGIMYSDGKGVVQDDKQAVRWYRKAANQGNANAQSNLGWMYENGKGVAQDDKQAVKWYRKAANQGYASAQYNLGLMYSNGKGVAQDDKQAVKWYRKAADQGDTLAQVNLGSMYIDGKGVLKDDKQAMKWYRKAADQGEAYAQYNLGGMYEYGKGVLQDDKQAVKWYRKAADQGNVRAQQTLGIGYYYGILTAKDYKKAFIYAKKSADQGDAQGQFLLGIIYENGKSVDIDNVKALALMRLAAKQGDREAITYLKAKVSGDSELEYKLGIIYLDAIDVIKDVELGKKWLKKSAQQGFSLAKIRLKQEKSKQSSFSKLWSEYGGSALDTGNGFENNTSTSFADTKAPVINLNQKEHTTVEVSKFNLSGSVKDDSSVSEVSVNGGLIHVDDFGKFSTAMYLGLGKNKFTIEAIDIFGNKASKSITVVRNKAIVKNKDKKLIPPTTQLASNPNSIALIIGLDDYKSMPNAPWAESDASTFYDYAHNVLGIPYERIRLITGQESDGIGIWKSLEQWLPSKVDKNKSNVYVYFAGHGLASEDGKDAYLMPYDGDTSMLSRTAIPRKDVISGLDSLKARSVTLFMDTCYSGSAKGGKQTLVASRGLRIVKKNTLADLPSNFTLFSAAANDETAISHPTQKNGLFSYWMMRGLGGEADNNNDRKITNGELHAFISDKVQKTAISKGHNQHPQLVGDKNTVIATW